MPIVAEYDPVPRILPLLFAQGWFYAANRTRRVYDVAVQEIGFTGEVNCEAIEHALRQLLVRHEALRVRLTPSGDGLRQEVIPPARFLASFGPLVRHLTGTTSQTVMEAFRAEPFTLTTAPLIRCAAFVTSPSATTVIFAANHVVIDGWSIRVLARDFVALYREAATLSVAALPNVSGSYSDYSRWYGALDAPEVEAHWAKALTPSRPLRGFPVEAASGRWRGQDQLVAVLPRWAELRDMAEQEGVSPARMLQAVTIASILPFAGASVETFVTDANRATPRLRETVGCLVDWLPINIATPADCCLRELLRELSAALREVRSYNVPFSAVANGVGARLVPPRELFDSSRVTINVLPPTLAGEPAVAVGDAAVTVSALEKLDLMRAESYPVAHPTVEYILWPRPSGIEVSLETHDTPRNRLASRRLGDALARLLPVALADPMLPLRSVANACWREACTANRG